MYHLDDSSPHTSGRGFTTPHHPSTSSVVKEAISDSNNFGVISGELPEDVLMKIFATLEVPDLVRAGSVCSSWLHAYNCLRKLGASIQPQTPSLIYTNKSSGASVADFYSLVENKPYTVTLPDPPIRNRYLIGSAYGWVVTADERSELHLVNPITRDQIALPSVTTIEQVKPIYDSNGAIHMYKYSRYTGTHGELDPPSVLRLDKLRDYIFHKAFLSSDPSTGNYIVVLIHHPYYQISFARAGDEHWTWLPYHSFYADCAFKDELLYALLVDGGIHAYNLYDPAVKPQVVMEGLKGCLPPTAYIAQAPCGDLLQIWKVSEYSDQQVEDVSEPDLDPPDDDEYFSVSEDELESEVGSVPYRHYTTVFKVYRVNLAAMKLVEISCLGDNILFLGLNQSICLCAKEYPQLKGNHIYFTDDDEYMSYGFKNKGRKMGVFNLGNKISEKIVSPRIWSNWPAPIWIVPNPIKMTSAFLSFVDQRTMEGPFKLNPNGSPFRPGSLSSFADKTPEKQAESSSKGDLSGGSVNLFADVAPEKQAESSSKGDPCGGTFDPSQYEEIDMDPCVLAEILFSMFPNISTDFIDELLEANDFDINLTIDMLHDDAEDMNGRHVRQGLPDGDCHHAEVSESNSNLNQDLQNEKSAITSDVKFVLPKLSNISLLHNVLGLPNDDKSAGTSVAKCSTCQAALFDVN